MTTHPITDGTRGTAPRTAVPAGRVLRAGGTVALVAVAANLLALLVGRLAGADMQVAQGGGDPQQVGVLTVVVATVVGMVLGTVLLLAVRNRGARAWTVVAVAGLVVGVATAPVPWSTTAEAATQATLSAMHVVAGVVWFLGVRRAARG